ncbi:MAG: hypothetical protein ACI82Z_001400 [Cellvibrionaceae bacterium]|jgi:hypothetical protein
MSRSNNNKRRKNQGRFAGIPIVVMNHSDYIHLHAYAVKLLMELARQYNGSNNGDLSLARSLMAARGFTCPQTITKYRDKLLEAKMILLTRQGRFMNPGKACTLYALTWHSIDECDGKLDVKSTTIPPRQFSLENNKKPCSQHEQSSVHSVNQSRLRNEKGRFVRFTE